MKINNISITSRDIEIISEALDELAQSYRDFQDECPEDCNPDEISRIVRRIGAVDDIINTILENSPVTLNIFKEDCSNCCHEFDCTVPNDCPYEGRCQDCKLFHKCDNCFYSFSPKGEV